MTTFTLSVFAVFDAVMCSIAAVGLVTHMLMVIPVPLRHRRMKGTAAPTAGVAPLSSPYGIGLIMIDLHNTFKAPMAHKLTINSIPTSIL